MASTPLLHSKASSLQFLRGHLLVAILIRQADDSIHTAQNQTERDALIKARVGQHGYRQALLDYWNGCAVTGCTVDSLLIASHIKPWSVDKEARLDVYNGLLLSTTLDLAFDKGLISFDDNGLIILSSQLSKEDRLQLHLDHSLRLRKLASQHRLNRTRFVGESIF